MKLPSDFDESLLSEFEDALQSVQNFTRVPGSLPFQGFRRNEHGSSPPTWGDSGKAVLLGRAIARVILNLTGTQILEGAMAFNLEDLGRLASKMGSLEVAHFQEHLDMQLVSLLQWEELMNPISLERTMSHIILPTPTRQCLIPEETLTPSMMKLLVHRRAMMRTEQRRRRASFEMIRKEQQRALQEKQKLNQGKHNASEVPGLFGMLEGENEGKGPSIRTMSWRFLLQLVA